MKSGKKLNITQFLIGYILCLLLTGCAVNTPTSHELASKSFLAMDTYILIKADAKEEVLTKLMENVCRLEELFSVTKDTSDVWKINHANGGWTEVHRETEELFREAVYYMESTGGALDISVYPAVKAWGFTGEQNHIPSQAELEQLVKHIGLEHLSVQDRQIRADVGTEIDFGAVAKGYTGDVLVSQLKDAGVTSAILSLGGNVQTIGTKPDGSPWKIGITNPFETDRELGVLSLEEGAVITSGNYERYFIGEDGKQYCHIIDPATGAPAASGLVSVTVIGKNGLQGDALSTALFVMGKERATAYWREHADFEMILVTQDRRIFATPKALEIFENQSECPVEIIGK